MEAVNVLPRQFTASAVSLAGRSLFALPTLGVGVRTHARGNGKALQELLDRREEDREEDDDTPVITQILWESPLKVLLYPDPKLRAPNARLGSECFDESLKKLADEMFQVMYE